MNICKSCLKLTKSGICLYYKTKILDIFDECEFFVSSGIENITDIPKIAKGGRYKRGDFCFLPHRCQCGCNGILQLKKEYINNYESNGYPKYIFPHNNSAPEIRIKNSQGNIGRPNPKFSEYLRKNNPMKNPEIAKKVGDAQIGSKNHRYGKHWDEEHKEILRQKTLEAHYFKRLVDEYWQNQEEQCEYWQELDHIKVELPKYIPSPRFVPKIEPEIKPISEAEKLKLAIAKLEKIRLEKLAKEKLEEANKPKEPEKSLVRFNMRLCFRENKLIKCKKTKMMCRDWEFCHKNDKNKHTSTTISLK